MSRNRDTQKARLYDAEDAVQQRGHLIPNADLQPWVDQVMRRKAIRSRWGDRHITVVLTHGGGRSHGGNEIRLGTWARNPGVILHEIAHCLTPSIYAWHGPEFAGVYLHLVRTVQGTQAGKDLLASYRTHRVRRNTKAIPDPKPVPTLAEKAARERAKATRPVSTQWAREAAEVIRQAAAAGQLGPADRKPRIHALATARLLEGIR